MSAASDGPILGTVGGWSTQIRVSLTIGLLLLAASTATALATEFQTTEPDACALLRHSDVAPALGAGVQSHAQKFPLPELSEADQDINHFLTVSRTQCTWVDQPGKKVAVQRIEALIVNVLDRNENYSGGGKPWDASREGLILIAIGGKPGGSSGYRLVSNDDLAKKLHKPQLAGDDVFIVVDRRTNGAKKAILGYRFEDGLWAYFGAITFKRNALNVVLAATKHVVAGSQ